MDLLQKGLAQASVLLSSEDLLAGLAVASGGVLTQATFKTYWGLFTSFADKTVAAAVPYAETITLARIPALDATVESLVGVSGQVRKGAVPHLANFAADYWPHAAGLREWGAISVAAYPARALAVAMVPCSPLLPFHFPDTLAAVFQERLATQQCCSPQQGICCKLCCRQGCQSLAHAIS